jgi:hypothetical protein
MGAVFNENTSGGGFGGFPVFGGGYGGGFGGDGLGLIALLALLGGRGFGRDGSGGGGGGGDSNAAVIAALSALTNRDNDDGCCEQIALMSKLASIEGLIPSVGQDLQLAMQQVLAGLTAQNTSNTQHVSSQIGQLQLGQLVQSNAIQSAICGVDTNIDRSTTTVTNAICASEARITDLITQNLLDQARADNVVLANKLAEERSEGRRDRDRSALEITMIQNQNAVAVNNIESRNRFDRLEGLIFDTVQNIRATNQAINIGAGTQTANPLNTNTNVKT